MTNEEVQRIIDDAKISAKVVFDRDTIIPLLDELLLLREGINLLNAETNPHDNNLVSNINYKERRSDRRGRGFFSL